MTTKLLRYLVTGDGFDYFTDDLADARCHAREWDGVIYERMDMKDAPAHDDPPAAIKKSDMTDQDTIRWLGTSNGYYSESVSFASLDS